MRTVVLLVGLTLVAGACGGDAMSAEEYFATVQSAAAAYDSATDSLLDEYNAVVGPASLEFEANSVDADSATLAAEKAKFLDVLTAEMSLFFERGGAALSSFVAALEALRPPEDMEAAHDEAVATLSRSLDAIPDLVDDLGSADSQQEIDAAINGSDFGDVQPRVVAACLTLQDLATARGMSVDLHCGDSE